MFSHLAVVVNGRWAVLRLWAGREAKPAWEGTTLAKANKVLRLPEAQPKVCSGHGLISLERSETLTYQHPHKFRLHDFPFSSPHVRYWQLQQKKKTTKLTLHVKQKAMLIARQDFE